jgi:hypothetical protein
VSHLRIGDTDFFLGLADEFIDLLNGELLLQMKFSFYVMLLIKAGVIYAFLMSPDLDDFLFFWKM